MAMATATTADMKLEGAARRFQHQHSSPSPSNERLPGMSRASKITLALTSLGTAGVVYIVHWVQQRDLQALHAGVVRDLENQQRKKSQAQLERQADFELQARLEAEYRKIQPVTGGLHGQEAMSTTNTTTAA
ncbi:hypothetical protein KEM52_000823 [Ascosphaera acerosa]|nr:hypothetical protein KEM52_000823 [Ascosphaera acerosa]